MKTKTIRQKAFIPASPDKVYQALMSSKEHAAFTEAGARIGSKKGAKFSAYDSYIEGKNLELLKGKKIVQRWKAAESNWPDGHYTTVTFNLKKKGKGTEITFTQKEVPSENFKSLSQGWKDYYWQPLKRYFGKGSNR